MKNTDRILLKICPHKVWSLVVCLLISQCGRAEELSTSQVVKEIRGGAVRLEAAEVGLTTWECLHEESQGGGKPTSINFIVKRHGASVLLDASLPLKPDHMRAVKNDSVMFQINSKKTTEPWVLARHETRITDQDWHKALPHGHFAVYPLLARNGSSTILHFLDDKSFILTRARKVAENRVELDYEVTDGDATGRGTLTLDPGLDWLVIRSAYTITSSGGGSGRTTFTRDAVRDGDRIRVKSMTHEAWVAGKPQLANISKYTFKLLDRDTVNPAEFTLEYYNLVSPESVEAYEDRPKFNWIRWGSVGVICIVLSVVLGWYARRRRTT